MPTGSNPNSRKNLEKGAPYRFKPGDKQVEIAKKGSKIGVEVRRQKKTVQKILSDFLDGSVASMPELKKFAAKYGLPKSCTVKDVFTVASVIGELKKASLDSVEKAQRILGESEYEEDIWSAERILTSIKECAYDENRDKPETS